MDEAFRNASQLIQTRGPEALNREQVSSFSPRSLETFVDLGMSDRQIARYLRTSETSVLSLRRHYGLSEAKFRTLSQKQNAGRALARPAFG